MLDTVRPDEPTLADIKPVVILRRKLGFFGAVVALLRVCTQLVLMIVVLGGAYLAMNRLIDAKPEPRKRPAFRTVYTVDAVEAKIGDHQPNFISYGEIAAARNVDLRSLVSGEVVSISDKLSAGSTVDPGEVLVEIDDFNYRGAVQEAKANLAEAEAKVSENKARIVSEQAKLLGMQEQLGIAGKDLDRANSLKARGTFTDQQVESRKLIVSQRNQSMIISENAILIEKARLRQQLASLERLKWRQTQAERNLLNTRLKAPFRGVIKTSSVERGKLVNANDVVVSLYDDRDLEARFTLTDAQYGRLQSSDAGLLGRNVDIIWHVGGKEFTFAAAIDRVGAEITSDRGGVEVFARISKLENAISIRPGAFVEVRVPDRRYVNTIKVPDTAIYESTYVYILAGGKLVKNKVQIAAYDGETAIISSGVKPGSKVLTTRIAEIGAGLNVREEGDAAPARPAGSKVGPLAQGRRPPPELIAKIQKANGLSPEKWQALPRPERHKLIQSFRAANSGKAQP